MQIDSIFFLMSHPSTDPFLKSLKSRACQLIPFCNNFPTFKDSGGKPEGVMLPVPFHLCAYRQMRILEKLFVLNLMIFKSLAPECLGLARQSKHPELGLLTLL